MGQAGISHNTFIGGMDQDTAPGKFKNDRYFTADNMRLTTKDPMSIGNIENEKGNELSFTFPDSADQIYVFDINVDGTWQATFGFNGSTTSVTTTTGNISDYLFGFIEDSASLYTPGSLLFSSTVKGYEYSIYENLRIMRRGNRFVVFGKNLTSLTMTKTGGDAGTEVVQNGQTLTDNTIVGYANLRDKLILFSTNKANIAESPTTTSGAIWMIEYNDNDAVVDIDTSSLDISKHLIYAGDINLSLYNAIKAVAFRINDDTGKVYWTDNYNNIRHINVYDYNSAAILEENLNLIPKLDMSKPQVKDLLNGGSYSSGVVYYSYQLYNKYGSESIMSPVSNGINLTESLTTLSDTSKFLGSAIDSNTAKAVKISIDDIDNNFDRMRLFSIFYESVDATPRISIVFDKRIRQVSSMEVIDDGFTFVGTITLQELRDYEKLLFSCKDMTLKDNRLICTNILEDVFDVDYDARAYRHDSAGDFSIDGAAAITGNDTNYNAVDDYADCVAGAYPTYKFQNDGSTIGGEGVNVTYNFANADLAIDKNSDIPHTYSAGREFQEWSSLDSSLSDNYSYSNYASPINASQMVGYKRGETYRCGIIFRDSRGRISPVKWIADMRFPEMDDLIFTVDETTGESVQYLDFGTGNGVPVTETPIYDEEKEYNDYFYTVDDTDDHIHTFTLVFGGETATIDIGGNGDLVTADTYYNAINDVLISTFNGVVTASMGIVSDKIYIKLTIRSLTSFAIGTANISNANGPIVYSFINNAASSGSSAAVSSNTTVSNIDNVSTAHVLYPVIAVDNVPLDDDGNRCSYQIVRVKRDEKDMSRLAQGLLLPTINASSVTSESYPVCDMEMQTEDNPMTIFGDDNDATGLYLKDNYLVNIISPDINFRSYDVRKSDVLRITGLVPANKRYYESHKNTKILKIRSVTAASSTSPIEGIISYSGIVKADELLSIEPTVHTIKDFNIRNIIKGNANGKHNAALAGTSLFVALASKLSTVVDANMHISEIVRTLAAQYGGSTYYNRQNNEYIGCGHFKTGHSGSDNNYVFGGDTYIAYFDYLRAMWTDKDVVKSNSHTGNYQQVLYIPVETVVNLDYRYDKSYSKLANILSDNAKYLQERAGDYSGIVGEDTAGDEVNYLQEYDLYLENRVYSKENETIIYLPKLEEEDISYRRDSDIIISEEFSYNVLTDNFIKFLPDNHKILNSEYGPINGIINYNDNVVIFQDKAVGIQQVNERSLVTDHTGATLVLGTGDVLGQYSYLTTSSGCMHRSSIVSADSGLYYFDAITRTFNTISGMKEVEVSTLKGMSSYFDRIIHNDIVDSDEPLLKRGVAAIYDENNKRILVTYRDGPYGFTVSYNELLGVFESLYDYQPSIYVKTFENRILSVDATVGGNLEDMYLHDAGDYGDYYGVKSSSFVTFIANDKPLVNKIFSNVEFNSRVSLVSPYSPTDTYYDETINFVQMYNDYQDTGELTVVQDASGDVQPSSPLEIKRRHRKWRFAIPRDDDPLSTRSTRFSSTYLFIKFKYTNNADKKFTLDDVLTYYYTAAY